MGLAALAGACSGASTVGSEPVAGQGDGGAGAPDGAVDRGDGGGGAPDATARADGAPDPDPGRGCGEFADAATYACAKDGGARGACAKDGAASIEVCANGCLRPPPGPGGVCMGTTSALDCAGSYGKAKAADGNYFITAFGCWLDDAGAPHTDPADNCIPTCLAQAKAAGLCDPNGTGKDCEEKITWFTADAARFGCLARLKVTDPKSGKAVVALALDYGPSCSVENGVGRAVLDTSGRIDRYLFGADQGATDKTLVHVVEVDDSYALGPAP